MKKTVKIEDISRVIKGKDSSGGNAISKVGTPKPQPAPTKSPSGTSGPKIADQFGKKKGPGTKVLGDLPDDVKLPDGIVDKIRQAIKQGQPKGWNIGGTGVNIDGKPVSVAPGSGGTPVDLPGGEAPEGDDTREWNKTPKELEKEIDRANRSGLDEEDKEKRKETKTDAEKTMGGSGGGGTIRDRMRIEAMAKTDWAEIFKTRLTEYSNEKTNYKPYHRRFVNNPGMRTRIPSREQQMDTLPALNVIIDTSSSLSYKELNVILQEVGAALSAANISTLNIIMWHTQAYYFREWKDVEKDDFSEVIDDVVNSWQGGGNDVNTVYELMIKKGIEKQFTIHLTDGYIQDHINGSSELLELVGKCLEPNDTIWGIIFKNRSVRMSLYEEMKSMFPGEILPLFLDSSKFS